MTVFDHTSSSFSLTTQQGLHLVGEFLGLGSADPRMIVASLVRIALGFLGIIFLVMILLAGFTLMTAGGNDERKGAAKRTFFNAIIGLIIILSANSIVTYVLRAFNGLQNSEVPANTSPAVAPSEL